MRITVVKKKFYPSFSDFRGPDYLISESLVSLDNRDFESVNRTQDASLDHKILGPSASSECCVNGFLSCSKMFLMRLLFLIQLDLIFEAHAFH